MILTLRTYQRLMRDTMVETKILIEKPADLKALEGHDGYVKVIDNKTYFCCYGSCKMHKRLAHA